VTYHFAINRAWESRVGFPGGHGIRARSGQYGGARRRAAREVVSGGGANRENLP